MTFNSFNRRVLYILYILYIFAKKILWKKHATFFDRSLKDMNFVIAYRFRAAKRIAQSTRLKPIETYERNTRRRNQFARAAIVRTRREYSRVASRTRPFITGGAGEMGLKCIGGVQLHERCVIVFQCSPLWRGWPYTLWTPSQRRSCSPANCAARYYAAKHPWNATLPTNTPNDRRSTDASSASGCTARVIPWWPIYIPIIRAGPATLTLSSFEGLDKVGTTLKNHTYGAQHLEGF